MSWTLTSHWSSTPGPDWTCHVVQLKDSRSRVRLSNKLCSLFTTRPLSKELRKSWIFGAVLFLCARHFQINISFLLQLVLFWRCINICRLIKYHLKPLSDQKICTNPNPISGFFGDLELSLLACRSKSRMCHFCCLLIQHLEIGQRCILTESGPIYKIIYMLVWCVSYAAAAAVCLLYFTPRHLKVDILFIIFGAPKSLRTLVIWFIFSLLRWLCEIVFFSSSEPSAAVNR